MKLSNAVKKGSAAVTVALGLTVLAPVSAEVAYAEKANNNAAQELVDSLEALNLDNVDYLYAYLQSISLSKNELNQIRINTKKAGQILKSAGNVNDLPNEQRVEVLRLFNENVKLAQLQAVIVDHDGNKINPLDYYNQDGANGLKVQLLDLNGNVLATVDPKKEDLNAAALQTKIVELRNAIDAKVSLDKEETFVPMPSAELPNTATDNPAYILIGGLLALGGAVALIPAARLARRTN